MKLIRHTTLRFTEGTSDKVYETDLVEVSGEYLVNFRYGKFGANLREGSKTKAPVELSQATKVADSLLVSKINKGYQVVEGYDPINKTMVGGSPQQKIDDKLVAKTANTKDRDNNIILRLNKFCEGNKHLDDTVGYTNTIDGYSFTRTLWKAGELRLSGLSPIIQTALMRKNLFTRPVDYYTALWALGRSADEASIKLVDKLSSNIPDNTEYMLTEVKMALASHAEQYLPKYDAIDAQESINRLQELAGLERTIFQRIKVDERIYIDMVLDLHGITADVKTAIQKLQVSDAFKNTDDYINESLSKESLEVLEKREAAYPKLSDTIESLLSHHTSELKLEQASQFKPNFDLYLEIVKLIDLNKLFDGDEDDIRNAERGRLGWLWGEDKRRLKQAVKKTRKTSNSQKLLDQVEQYEELISDISVLSTRHLEDYHQILREAGVYDEVIGVISKADTNDYFWEIKGKFTANTRAKFDDDVHYQVGGLIEHQLGELKYKALKSKDELLKQLHDAMLGQYWQLLVDNQQRGTFLESIKDLPVTQPFTHIFRRLYKMAEFRDDHEVLAILNHGIERTAPSSYYYQQRIWFSKNTKEYFQRRIVRTLKKTANFSKSSYSQFASAVLLQADDADESLAVWSKKKQFHYFPRLAAFNYVLHANSVQFKLMRSGEWRLLNNKNETSHPEAHPKLWNQPEDLLVLLMHCKAKLVNDFAFNNISKHQQYLSDISQADWIMLVQRPYENTALLALDYLQDDLNNTDVMTAVLFAQFSSVRKKALIALDGESLGDNLELLILMLLSEHDDVYEFARSYLYTAQERDIELSNKLIEVLLQADETLLMRLIPRIEWLLLKPLKAKSGLSHITKLLHEPSLDLQILATKLLKASDYSFEALKDNYQLMSSSQQPEIRAGAIALLAKLESEEIIKHQDLLFNALIDEHPDLREQSREVVLGIDDVTFKIDVFNHILPELFKAEPVDGYADDMFATVEGLSFIYSDIDTNVLWRLLQAKSKLAERVGALILPAREVSEFSVKQLSLLTKNATLSVREWALEAFEQDLSLTTENYSQAIRLLDNRWEDSRKRAITFFQTRFDESFWNSERTIAVCDNIYSDVQRFGRDLVTKFFDEDQGEEYLIKLSQHPSANVQLFVSGFLKEYATNKYEITLSLQPYFRTVLSQVNRGRIVKDRIINFLFDEAQKDKDVATMVAELFSDQSISMVVADKMQYIKTLFELQQQFSHIKTPVVSIEPEVRAI